MRGCSMTFWRRQCVVAPVLLGAIALLGQADLSFGETPSESELVAVVVGAYEDRLYPVAESQILEFLRQFPQSNRRLTMTYLLGRIYFLQAKYRKSRETFLNLINDKSVDTVGQMNGLFWLAESSAQLNRWEEAKAYYTEFVGKASESPFLEKSLFALGVIALKEKALTEAEEYFKKGLMEFPNGRYRFQQKYYLGLIDGRSKNYHRAVQLLGEAISPHSDLPLSLRRDALFELAENRLRLGQYQLALPLYLEFYSTYPDDHRAPSALYGAGWCQLNTGQRGAALESFREVMERFPKSGPNHYALYRIGEIHLERKNYEKAREAFRQLVDGFPDSEMLAPALVNLGWSLLNLGSFDEMTRVAHRLLNLPSGRIEKTLPQLLLGEAHFLKGEYKEALPYFFNLLNTPSQRENALNKISRCYFHNGEYKDAITNVEILSLEYPDSKNLAESLYLRGQAAFRLGDTEKAIASFSEILEKNRNDSWTVAAQYELGKIYYERKDLRKAKKLFSRIVRDAPNSSTADLASYYLGIMYFKEENSPRALLYLDRALESPNEAIKAESHYRIGEIFFRKKAYDLALSHFQIIVETLADQNGWVELAFFEIGNIHHAQGESAEAQKAFQKVLELSKDPDLREASEKMLTFSEGPLPKP